MTSPAMDPPGMDPRAAALMAKMARYRLFVIFWQGHGRDLSGHLADHLAYMIEVEKSGRLFASGPLGEGARGDGMTVVRAPSPEEAEALAKEDPFVRAGLRTYTIEPWLLMEGRVTVSVDLSDSSMSFA